MALSAGLTHVKPGVGARVNSTHPLSKGLAAAWLFNEGTGTQIHDYAGNGKRGNFIANTTWVKESHGPVAYFDGVGDRIDVGTSAANTTPYVNFNKPFSLVMLVKLDAPSDTQNLVCSLAEEEGRSSFRFAFSSIASYQPFYWGTTDWGIARIPSESRNNYNDVWTHIVVTYLGTNVGNSNSNVSDYDAFVNGVEKAVSYPAGSGDVISYTTFGSTAWTATWDYKGSIDHIYLYDKVLRLSEVTKLYANPYQMFHKDPLFGNGIIAGKDPDAVGGKKDKIIGGF